MFYYLYIITNLANQKIYAGVHMTDNLDDGYMGSGKIIKAAIKKYGVENFEKQIISFFDDSEKMYIAEKQLVTDEFISRGDTYNLRRGGTGGFDHINKSRTSAEWSALGKLANSYSPGNKNIVRNNEWRQKLSIGSIGNKSFTGRTHSEETKIKMAAAHRGRQAGDKNSQFGSMWITDGENNRKIRKDDVIPDGWHRGRTQKFE